MKESQITYLLFLVLVGVAGLGFGYQAGYRTAAMDVSVNEYAKKLSAYSISKVSGEEFLSGSASDAL